MSKTYTYSRDQRAVVGSGRIVLKDDCVELTPNEERDPVNARLIRLGALVPVPESTPPTPTQKKEQ